MKRRKALYIVCIICYSLAAIGGALTVIGVVAKNPVLQLIGIPLVLVGYVSGLILDKLSEKKE